MRKKVNSFLNACARVWRTYLGNGPEHSGGRTKGGREGAHCMLVDGPSAWYQFKESWTHFYPGEVKQGVVVLYVRKFSFYSMRN